MVGDKEHAAAPIAANQPAGPQRQPTLEHGLTTASFFLALDTSGVLRVEGLLTHVADTATERQIG